MFEEPGSARAPDRIGDWALRGGVALAFVLFGLDKFPSGANAPWAKFFEQVGVGQWFRYFTGVVEIAGAGLVLVPKSARLGLAILAATMLAASSIHVFVIHQPGNVIITGGLFVALLAFWWSRRKDSAAPVIE